MILTEKPKTIEILDSNILAIVTDLKETEIYVFYEIANMATNFNESFSNVMNQIGANKTNSQYKLIYGIDHFVGRESKSYWDPIKIVLNTSKNININEPTTKEKGQGVNTVILVEGHLTFYSHESIETISGMLNRSICR